MRERPAAVLLVEFAEAPEENERRLKRLHELMGDLGFDWSSPARGKARWGGVVDVLDPKLQGAITELRTAGLNIMMSMKEAGKPVSFVEDCAVPLEHLAEYDGAAHRGVRAERHAQHLGCAAHPSATLHVRAGVELAS